jgi:hypothetical protein
MPRASERLRDRSVGQAAEQVGVGARRSEGETDAGGGLDDTGCGLETPRAPSRKRNAGAAPLAPVAAMMRSPCFDPGDIRRAAEVVPVLGSGEPSSLASGFEGLARAQVQIQIGAFSRKSNRGDTRCSGIRRTTSRPSRGAGPLGAAVGSRPAPRCSTHRRKTESRKPSFFYQPYRAATRSRQIDRLPLAHVRASSASAPCAARHERAWQLYRPRSQ